MENSIEGITIKASEGRDITYCPSAIFSGTLIMHRNSGVLYFINHKIELSYPQFYVALSVPKLAT